MAEGLEPQPLIAMKKHGRPEGIFTADAEYTEKMKSFFSKARKENGDTNVSRVQGENPGLDHHAVTMRFQRTSHVIDVILVQAGA